jgi:archaellum component FlaG (FlaF/FlaG flagellin family)
MPYIDTILRVIGTVALCYIAGMLSKGVSELSRLTDAVKKLNDAVVKKLGEAVDIIRDPNQENEQAAVMLEELSAKVDAFDLTPDNPNDNGEPIT